MSKHNLTQIVRDLGSAVSFLSPENVSEISWSDLKKIQQNASVQWTPAQMYALVKKKLGGERVSCTHWPEESSRRFSLMLIVPVWQCKQVTGEEVMDLGSLARGLPSCVLKKVKAMKLLIDRKEMRNITERMRKGQLKAVLQRVSEE